LACGLKAVAEAALTAFARTPPLHLEIVVERRAAVTVPTYHRILFFFHRFLFRIDLLIYLKRDHFTLHIHAPFASVRNVPIGSHVRGSWRSGAWST
jgi:hypothetical protein